MAEQKESSVLFSLKELMNLEEDRIKQEDEDKKRRGEADARARADAERRARDQEQARLTAEEERRRSDEQRKREEAVRLDAIRHGEIEKARVEAEQRARMEALAKQQEHERHITSLKHDEHKKKLQRNLMLAVGGGAIVVFGGLGVYFGKIRPEAEAREAATRAALVQQAEETRRAQQQLADSTAKVNDLLSQLSSAQDDKTRAELKSKLAEAQRAQAGAASRASGGGSKGGGGEDKPKPPKKECNCQPGDPLCSCL
jgi:colicin import membrane protein